MTVPCTQVLQQHPQLRSLKLCSCAAVTDAPLQRLPARSLRELQLVCCDSVRGHFLARLPLLEVLRLTSCGGIDPEAAALVGLQLPIMWSPLLGRTHTRPHNTCVLLYGRLSCVCVGAHRPPERPACA